MADVGAIASELSPIIVALIVGVTAVVFLYKYIEASLSVSKTDQEVKSVETTRKKKSTDAKSAAPQKNAKKKQPEKWNQDSKQQSFSHAWLLTSLKGHSGRVLDMDFSSNGKFLATCAEDTTDDLDPGGGEEGSEQCSENSSGSEGNKENSPEPGTNQKGSGLTRRQKRNRIRRDDDSPVPRVASTNTKKTKPKRRMNNSENNTSNSSHANAPALRQHARLNLADCDLSVLLRHYVLSGDQLLGLGYPVESTIFPGRAVIYKNRSATSSPYSAPVKKHTLVTSSHFDVNAREFVPMSKQTSDTSVYTRDCQRDGTNSMFTSHLANKGNPGMDYREISVEWNAERRVKTEYYESYQQVSSEEASSSSSQEISGSSDFSELNDVSTLKNSTSIYECNKNNVRKRGGCKEPMNGTVVDKQWSGSDEKRCVRCSRGFFVTLDGEYLTQERCMYHWGKLQKVVDNPSIYTEYSCCKGNPDARGCTTGKLHVWNGVGVGINGPFNGYVRTRPRKTPPSDGNYGIYALDCEMCFTTRGLELTKVTVVGADGRLVYDCLVRPENYIIDYNTRFSGITARDLSKRGATKSLQEVQSDLISFINSDTILVGHGLENDLRALRIIHSTVIDTSVAFPHYYGLPYRRSLKSLVGCFLKRDIQQDSSGHDSFEDARACIELMLWRLRKDFHSILG